MEMPPQSSIPGCQSARPSSRAGTHPVELGGEQLAGGAPGTGKVLREGGGENALDWGGGRRSGLPGSPFLAGRPWGRQLRLWTKVWSTRPLPVRLPTFVPAGLCQVGLSWLLRSEWVFGVSV